MSAIVLLRDLTVESLSIDGTNVGNPKLPHPDFRGGFRGYFNVPPGPHSFVADLGQGRVAKWDVEVPHGDRVVIVKRLHFDAVAWVDDDPDTKEHFERLAASGSMHAAGALRPWPL